jgi:hypothetical protein
MNNLLYIIAFLLGIAWLIGLVNYHAGWMIHLLLLLAIIALMQRFIHWHEKDF